MPRVPSYPADASLGGAEIIYVVDGGVAKRTTSGAIAQIAIDQIEASDVQSVNGATGVVVLDAGDVGAQPADADLTALASAGNSTVLAATTASFLTADETKLDALPTAAALTTSLAGKVGVARFTAARWAVTGEGPTVATRALAAGNLFCVKKVLPPCTIDRLGVGVTTLEASTVIRLGVRADSNGQPGALLDDLGTVSGGAVSDALELATTSPIVHAGGPIWFECVGQNGSTTLAVRGFSGGDSFGLLTAATSAAAVSTTMACLFQAGVTGALPAGGTGFTGLTTAGPRISIRIN